MIDVENKLSELIQTKVTRSDSQRIKWLAETEQRKVADMIRVLILESLDRWEKSAPGRRRRK